MKFLFIGAHQDDIEYSCGGTLLRLADEGHEVYMVVMTNGGASLNGTTKEREAEQRKASEYARVNELIMLDCADGYIWANADTVGKVCDILERIKPDVVLTHYPHDSHQDHRAVSAIVKSATRRKYSLVYFDSYSSIDFKANLYVDIEGYTEDKKELLRMFESQITKYERAGIDFVEKSILIPKMNGYESKSKYAEGYAIDTVKM